MQSRQTAVVIGAGFYGLYLAALLKRNIGFSSVIVLEQENCVMSRASYNNQARVHQGYHYPRSIGTGLSSRNNFDSFNSSFSDAVVNDFTKLYMIAKSGSKVTARQFEKFCLKIGAPYKNETEKYNHLVDSDFIEQIYETQEHSFDAKILAQIMLHEVDQLAIEILLNTEVCEILSYVTPIVRAVTNGVEREFEADLVVNCTYSGIESIKSSGGPQCLVKHEITEMGIAMVGEEYQKLGITVMDGAFFSIMPFPHLHAHSISHVRYTPHLKVPADQNPYEFLAQYDKKSRVDFMIRDIRRYLPEFEVSQMKNSLFEVKTVLKKNELDDGRPILYHLHNKQGSVISILGGKIDNIFDIGKVIQRQFGGSYV